MAYAVQRDFVWINDLLLFLVVCVSSDTLLVGLFISLFMASRFGYPVIYH
jgi:flagellar biosynthesis protein FliQ